MSKQFEVIADGNVWLVEAVSFASMDGELFCYDKDEKIVHQFHSWTGVRTLTPAPAEQAVSNAVENVCRADAEAMERQALAAETKAYREGYEKRMSCETPERRDERRGWDDADNAVRAKPA